MRWRTYEDLQRDIWQFVEKLAADQVAPGDRILLWAANSPEWVACLFGALLRGAVVVPVDATASQDFVARIAADSAAKVVFHAPELESSFLPVPSRRLETPLHDGIAKPVNIPVAPVKPDDPAVVMYTSGSTASPRAVVLTHRNLQAQIEHFRRWRALVRVFPFRMLVIAPLSHVQGLILGAFLPLSIGLSVVFVSSVHPQHLLRTLRDNRITLFSTVPRVLSVLTQALEAQRYKSGPLTLSERLARVGRGFVRRHILFQELNRTIGLCFWVILVGGATLPRHDEQFWRDTGRFVIQGYGLTETTALVAVNGPFSRAVGSIGREMKDVSVRIADDGELLVKGAIVSPAYNAKGDSGVSHEAGYLRTGDLVRRSGGRLYFVGRKKDIIVTSEGFNVAPSDVECVLNRVPGVIDSIVFGKHSGGNEEVHAVLLLRPGTDAAQVVQLANSSLLIQEKIRSWSVWPESDFPRTSLLKVRRDDVRAGIEANRGDHVETRDGASPSAPAGPLALDCIAREPDRRTRIGLLAHYLVETPREEVVRNPSQLGTDFGLGSLDYVELLARVEELRGQRLSPVRLPLNATIANVRGAFPEEFGRVRNSCLPLRQPVWAEWPPVSAIRGFTRPVVVAVWRLLSAGCSATWFFEPDGLFAPFFLAAAPHRHWLDAFAITAALPERLARRMLVVTNRDFSEHFDPDPETRWTERLRVALGYYVGLPLIYTFTIVPPYGATREGLLETMRWVDKGYCPLVFPKGILFGEVDPNRHDLGPYVMAIESGLPIVPVWICGNQGLTFQPRRARSNVHVLFGPPIRTSSENEPAEIRDHVEGAWRFLQSREH